MADLAFSSADALGLAAAAFGGLAVGLERQWSGSASGARPDFAGLRTFTMIGIVAGISGWLWSASMAVPAAILLTAVVGLTAIAYFRSSAHEVDATTEVAALVVVAAGVMSGLGLVRVGMAVIAITVLFLTEKRRLHGWASRLNDEGVTAGARFAVMALVILPILPTGPYGPWDAVHPRELWTLVMLFSGLSFASYVARRAIGNEHGYAVSGILGGFISSTAVTLTMSRLSQHAKSAGGALASGVMGANTMLFLRVLAATAFLARPVTMALWPSFVAPFLIGAALTGYGIWNKRGGGAEKNPEDSNPLQLKAAIEMALLFQVVLFAMAAFKDRFTGQGLYASAAVLGLTDVDALTLSMSRAATSGTPVEMAVRAITIGILANALVKLGLVLGIGRGTFRIWAGLGLTLIAVTLAAWIFLNR